MINDGRRSPRVVLEVPIGIVGGKTACEGQAAVVNRHGALILCPLAYPQDSTVQITNLGSGETAPFRIVWLGQDDAKGMHKAGTEMLEERPDFWGSAYDERAGRTK